jgi:osomolarity two-component system phosphorelay intermediate protein YPD1
MAPTEDDDQGETTLGHLMYGDIIDKDTFDQVLEMDDDDTVREFSREIVFDFFSQAKTTFEQIDEALQEESLKTLSDLGHFLKGSSATLGFIKVQNSCEKIQRYGKRENLDGSPGPDDKTCLSNIATALKDVKAELSEVRGMMHAFYGVDGEEGDEDDDDDDDDSSSDDDDEDDDEEDGEGEDDDEDEDEAEAKDDDKKAKPTVSPPVAEKTVAEKTRPKN